MLTFRNEASAMILGEGLLFRDNGVRLGLVIGLGMEIGYDEPKLLRYTQQECCSVTFVRVVAWWFSC